MIYTVNNTAKMGRPMRVFVNGNPVEHAIRADTERGVVTYITQSPRINWRKGEVYSRKLLGYVTVEPLNG